MQELNENIYKKASDFILKFANSNEKESVAIYFTLLTASIFDLKLEHPIIAFQKKYLRKNYKSIIKLIDGSSIDCDHNNLITNEKVILYTILRPLMAFWFQKYFKKRLLFFNKQKFGSRKINNAIYNGVEGFLNNELENVSSASESIKELKRLTTANFKNKSKFLDLNFPSDECLTNEDDEALFEQITEQINYEIDLKVIEENFFKRSINKIKGLYDYYGSSDLTKVVFKVSNKLNLDYSIIKYVLDNISNLSKSDKQRSRKGAKTGRVNTYLLSQIIAVGLIKFLYKKIGTENALNKVFKNKQISDVIHNFTKEIMDTTKTDGDLVTYIVDEIYDEVDTIYQEITDKNRK